MSELLHNESQNKGIEVLSALESDVAIPEKPIVSPREGFHLRVQPKTEQLPFYETASSIKESLRPFLVALASARTVFGDPSKPEEYHYWSQWVNLHCVPRFGGQNHLQFEVIGRNARGNTWAKPVEYPSSEEYVSEPALQDEISMVQNDLPIFLDEIEREAQETVIFDQTDTDIKTERTPKTIFSFQNYDIVAPIGNPHVNEGGLHLWINAHRKENAEGVQSEVKNGVEQFIIASAVAKSIYEALGVKIEIHFSGNWGLPTKGHWSESLSAHANLYGAPPGEGGVKLPSRPDYERPTIPEEAREQIRQTLEKNLPKYLNEFINFDLANLISRENI